MTLAFNGATVKLTTLKLYPLKSASKSGGVFSQNHIGLRLPVGCREHAEPKAMYERVSVVGKKYKKCKIKHKRRAGS